jgi:hypothetical protein
MRLFLIGWAVLLVFGFGFMGLAARSNQAPQASAEAVAQRSVPAPSPPPASIFAAHPWPDLERLGTETYEIAAALVNKENRFYCPRVTDVFALGTDERGWNRAKVVCIFAGTPTYERSFDISGHPTTGETIVRLGRPIMQR